jgi:hypothetical protein
VPVTVAGITLRASAGEIGNKHPEVGLGELNFSVSGVPACRVTDWYRQ